MCPDEDPKLEQGSRPCARGTHTPIIQPPAVITMGTDNIGPHEARLSLHIIEDDITTLYLTADAPQLYCEAMKHIDADDWVEAIAVEFKNLSHKDVFIEVELSPDIHIHDGQLVFTEKI